MQSLPGAMASSSGVRMEAVLLQRTATKLPFTNGVSPHRSLFFRIEECVASVGLTIT